MASKKCTFNLVYVLFLSPFASLAPSTAVSSALTTAPVALQVLDKKNPCQARLSMVPSLRIQALHQSSAPSDASEIILFHSKSLAPSRAYSLALATPQRKYEQYILALLYYQSISDFSKISKQPDHKDLTSSGLSHN